MLRVIQVKMIPVWTKTDVLLFELGGGVGGMLLLLMLLFLFREGFETG